MQQAQHAEQRHADRECAQCGHAERFHAAASDAGVDEAQQKTVCTSPEDGQPCPCKNFGPL
jgi:hypothetical protein